MGSPCSSLLPQCSLLAVPEMRYGPDVPSSGGRDVSPKEFFPT